MSVHPHWDRIHLILQLHWSVPQQFHNTQRGQCMWAHYKVTEQVMQSRSGTNMLIKDFSKMLSPYITDLFNKLLILGHFPAPFRVAEVTPILKKSSLDPTLPVNYRPVSNLQFISKVLERAVNKQIVLHLDGNSLLPEYQSAYRKCHSTETALLKVTSDALIAADRGMITLLGMLDLSAAFDCVDHQIFATRMERTLGINSVATWVDHIISDWSESASPLQRCHFQLVSGWLREFLRVQSLDRCFF